MTSTLLSHIRPGTPGLIIAAALTALFLHIAGGSLGVVTGYGAVFVRKGERWHRLFGTAFVAAMLTMAGMATLLAVPLGEKQNIAGGILALYLVATGWMTVRRPEGTIGWFEWIACLVAFGIAAAFFGWGVEAANSARPDALPALYYIFGTVSLLLAFVDLRVIFRGGVSGVNRTARHLWRMCFAFFFAAGSVFLGQQKVMPKFMHGSPVLWLLALAPLGFLLFWLIRVRSKKAQTATA
jgi:hypothetical protein